MAPVGNATFAVGRSCYRIRMAMPSRADLLKLDVATRLELIDELWDSIASDPESAAQIPLTDVERQLLEDRLREHRDSPAPRSWADVRADILKMR